MADCSPTLLLKGAVRGPYEASPSRVLACDRQAELEPSKIPSLKGRPAFQSEFAWDFQMICVYSSNTHTPSWVVVHRACIWQYLARSTTRPLCFTTFLLPTRINLQTSNLAQSLISDVFLCFLFFFERGVMNRGRKNPVRKTARVWSPSRLLSFQGLWLQPCSQPCSFLIQAQLSAAFWMISVLFFVCFYFLFFGVKGDSRIIMF